MEGLGVTHTVEVNAIWGPECCVGGGAPDSYNSTGVNANIVPVIQGYWTSFIRSFNPNTYRAAGTPMWEVSGGDGYSRIHFVTNATAMEVVPADQRERCQFAWSIGPSIQQ